MDVKELKEVLVKVETKIAAVKKIHMAMAFIYWESALAVLYMLLMLVNLSSYEYAIYWACAIAVYYFIWRRTKAIFSTCSPTAYMAKALIVATIVSIPLIGCIERFLSFEYVASVSVLCIISVYLLVLGLAIKRRSGSFPKEMIPATLCFAFTPLILVSNDPLYFAGFVVIVTYNITALLSLMSAVGVLSD